LVGQRSGVSPLFGSERSQNQLKVRRSRVSRKAVCRTDKDVGVLGPTPVIDVALLQAETPSARTTAVKCSLDRTARTEILRKRVLLRNVHSYKNHIKKPALTAVIATSAGSQAIGSIANLRQIGLG
jgi:hypothetical protein